MTIVKRSGSKEDFSPDKLCQSIAAASDEVNQPLNESDLKIIISDFLKIVSGKESITSEQINIIICGLLYSKGYFNTLEKYTAYRKA